MNAYEIMVCLRPDLSEEEVNAYPERLATLITTQGGQTVKDTTMGRRRLAYPIRHFHEGFYHVLNFILNPAQVEQLEFQLRVNEDVLRHIIIREGE